MRKNEGPRAEGPTTSPGEVVEDEDGAEDAAPPGTSATRAFSDLARHHSSTQALSRGPKHASEQAT